MATGDKQHTDRYTDGLSKSYVSSKYTNFEYIQTEKLKKKVGIVHSSKQQIVAKMAFTDKPLLENFTYTNK